MLKITKVKPMFNTVITTAEKYEEDYRTGGLIDPSKSKGSLKEYQTVVAVGSMVKGIEVGDKVMIDPTRYAVMKHKSGSLKDGVIEDNPIVGFNFKTVFINDVQHLMLVDADIRYVFEGEEIPDEPEPVIQVIKNEILPTS
jgi:hypothetical protein